MTKTKTDSILSTIALILAVVSIVNFQKVLIIVQLIIAVIILGYSIYKIIIKDAKVPMLVFSAVGVINSILWIIFEYGVYDSLIKG